MPPTVLVLHRGQEVWARQILRSVRKRARLAHLPTASFAGSTRAPSSLTGMVSAVCLATRRAARDPTLATEIATLQANGVVVVPVVRAPDVFSDAVLPALLAPTQGIRWTGSGHEVADYLLRAVGLAEEDRRVFISYGRRDTDAIARQLHTRLTERGFDVFLDRFSLKPGDDWSLRLDAELADKSFVLVLESDAAAESRWVQHEVVYALKNHLGLKVFSLPGHRSDRLIAAVPEAFREYVPEAQLVGTGSKRRLRAAELERIVSAVEIAHDEALVRRRSYLLLSAQEMVSDAGWRVLAQPDWSFLAERDPDRREFVRISPRPPRPQDLRRLDRSRRDFSAGGVVPDGHLVHECAALDPAVGDLLAWIAADRGLSTPALESITSALDTP